MSIVGNRLGAKYAIRLGANIVRRVLYLVIGLLMVSIIAKVVFYEQLECFRSMINGRLVFNKAKTRT